MGFSHQDSDAPPYPGVPVSLSHDAVELQRVKLGSRSSAGDPDPEPQPQLQLPPQQYDSAGDITPYLGLRARLSQVWLNRWTVLLLLVLVRVLILISSLHDDIGSAQAQALSACTKVEDVGSAMASMPHYLSVGVNDLAATGISKTVQGMVELLGMVLTGIEQLILFVINFYIGTYVCLTSALVHGGLDVGIGAADAATEAMNDAIGDITTTLSNDVSSVQDTINAAFSTIASASSIFGDTIKAPTLDLSGPIGDLKNIKVDDTSFVKTLAVLNKTVPTYDDAENFTRNAISIPFKAVRTVLNNTYGAYTFDTSVFPVAKKTALTFCSGNDTISNFFAALFALADHARTAFVAVLLVLAVLACVPMTVLEVRRFRSQQRRARALTAHGYDPMDVVYIASRPYTAGAGLALAARFRAVRTSAKRQLLVRWAWAYATSYPALFVLSLAVAGFVSCVCQAVLLAAVRREAPALTAEVSNFADNVVGTLESVSTNWANDANGVLLGFQNEINNDLLGYVVNATTAVNHTLNVFTEEIASGIDAVFNGTVLDNTVKQIVRCLIGIKVDAVEDGLTWVHDHAHVSLPLFPNNTFSVGARESIANDSSLSSFLADPGSVTPDDITAAVNSIVTFLRNSLVQEALISTALLLVYVVVVLLGVVRAMAGMMRPERTRGDGGQRYYYPGSGVGGGAGTASDAAVPAPVTRHRNIRDDREGRDDRDDTPPFFPRFDVGAETAAADDATAARMRDEKLVAAVTARSVGRAVYEKKGHWRDSSYGDVDDGHDVGGH